MEIDLSDKDLEGVLDIEQYCKDNNIDTEKVTSLDCSDNQLTEIKGLDKLVNLEELYCGNNKLTELDVSKLVNVWALYCDENKLTELDVSKLVNLEWLYCHCNELTELDLSNLVKLEVLQCDSNEITEIKGLDKLVNLEWLNLEEYIHFKPEPEPEPEQDKLDLLTNRVEKLEQIILELTKGK